MQWMRSTLFNIFFLGGTFFVSVMLIPTLFLPERYVRVCFRAWFSMLFWLLKHLVGITWRAQGVIPTNPHIFASKHQSAFETLALYCLIPNAVFVVKKELTWIPVVGWFFPKQSMISVGRGAKTSARDLDLRVRSCLEEGRSVVLFPEGTRTEPGAVPSYRRGIGFLYEKLQVPVVPVALNSGAFWGRRAFQKKPGEIVVSFLRPIQPGLTREGFMAALESEIEGGAYGLLPQDVSRETFLTSL